MLAPAALISALALALTTQNAPPNACATKGNRTAKIMVFERDSVLATTARISLVAVLSERAAAKTPRTVTCVRRTVRLGGEDYTLTGENGEDQPRRLVSAHADSPLFYLAPFENIAAALSGGRSPQRLFALVVADSRGVAAYRAYTYIPTDEALIADAEAIAAGKLGPLAALSKGGETLHLF